VRRLAKAVGQWSTASVWGKGINNPGRLLLLANGEVGGKLEAFEALGFFAWWCLHPEASATFPRLLVIFFPTEIRASLLALTVGNATSPR